MEHAIEVATTVTEKKETNISQHDSSSIGVEIMGCTEQRIPVGHLGVEGIVGKTEYKPGVTIFRAKEVGNERQSTRFSRGGGDPGS